MKRLLGACGLALTLGLCVCDSPRVTDVRESGMWPVTMRVVAAPLAQSTYRITVSGSGMQTIGPHEYAGGQTIEMYVPEGAARVFRFERFDQAMNLTDTATTVANIGSGMNTVTVTLVSVTPDTPRYTVTYDGNDNTGGTAPAAQIKTHGVALTLAARGNLVRTDFSFTGWNTARAGNGAAYDERASYTVDSSVTLYAQWAADSTGAWVVTPSELVDPDGNRYTTVVIGAQTWTVQNLRTSRFNNGDSITLVTNDTVWSTLTTAAYCHYENATDSLSRARSALYNWYAVGTGRLAPAGWHVASDSDWIRLATHLGGYAVAGGALKDTGIAEWMVPNTGATNASGFTGRPYGYRGSGGRFYGLSRYGYFWTSTSTGANAAYHRIIKYDTAVLSRATDLSDAYGCAVRLIKD